MLFSARIPRLVFVLAAIFLVVPAQSATYYVSTESHASDGNVTISGSQLPTNQYYSFDVTALVNEYIASGNNAGFLIKARHEVNNYIAFYGLGASSSSTYPKLEITPGSNGASGWAVYQ